MKRFSAVLAALMIAANGWAQDANPPVRLAIIGLAHDHAYGFLPELARNKDLQLTGIVETNEVLIRRYSDRFHLDPRLFYSSVEDLFAHTNVEAVALFTSAYEHREMVEKCAPHGVAIMMEKPMAVNLQHARAIAAAAKKNGVEIVVNYETTWYPANHAMAQMVRAGEIGDLRKVVVHDGHRGPKEIGCSKEFLDWLTDPKLNGGGALIDFGCYGADLIAWLMNGERPTSVFAVTQQIKPEIYPKVEDEATIVVTYPKMQGIIQASWNWPFDRKDMEVYGKTGSILIPKRDTLKVRLEHGSENETTIPAMGSPTNNAASYLAAVARKEIKPSGLSGIEVNLVAMEILDAAKRSAKSGKRIDLHD